MNSGIVEHTLIFAELYLLIAGGFLLHFASLRIGNVIIACRRPHLVLMSRKTRLLNLAHGTGRLFLAFAFICGAFALTDRPTGQGRLRQPGDRGEPAVMVF